MYSHYWVSGQQGFWDTPTHLPLPQSHVLQYTSMKANLHPTYNQVTVTCSCGASFTTGSTSDNIVVDICSKCHPFFTGEQRFVDKVGRVQRFQAKQKSATGKKAKKDRKSSQTGPSTLSELRASQK